MVSHDLRTPVTAIQASVSALQEADSRLPETVRARLLRNIESESDRLAAFISDALALARLEAGVAARVADGDAGEIAAAVLDECVPILGRRPSTFDVPDDLPLVRCDPVLLERALTNVLSNVASHTPDGTAFSIRGRQDGEYVRLEISDAGPGIPAESRERVLRKFERGMGSTRGAGLGLALAHAAITAQNGQLWIEESAAGGTSVVVLLNLAHST